MYDVRVGTLHLIAIDWIFHIFWKGMILDRISKPPDTIQKKKKIINQFSYRKLDVNVLRFRRILKNSPKI